MKLQKAERTCSTQMRRMPEKARGVLVPLDKGGEGDLVLTSPAGRGLGEGLKEN
jgi:hypothetical protein